MRISTDKKTNPLDKLTMPAGLEKIVSAELLIHSKNKDYTHLQLEDNHYIINNIILDQIKVNLEIRSPDTECTDENWKFSIKKLNLMKEWLEEYATQIDVKTVTLLIFEALESLQKITLKERFGEISLKVSTNLKINLNEENIIKQIDTHKFCETYIASPYDCIKAIKFTSKFPNFIGIHDIIGDYWKRHKLTLIFNNPLRKLRQTTDNFTTFGKCFDDRYLLCEADAIFNNKDNVILIKIDKHSEQDFIKSYPSLLSFELGKLIFGGNCFDNQKNCELRIIGLSIRYQT